MSCLRQESQCSIVKKSQQKPYSFLANYVDWLAVDTKILVWKIETFQEKSSKFQIPSSNETH